MLVVDEETVEGLRTWLAAVVLYLQPASRRSAAATWKMRGDAAGVSTDCVVEKEGCLYKMNQREETWWIIIKKNEK